MTGAKMVGVSMTGAKMTAVTITGAKLTAIIMNENQNQQPVNERRQMNGAKMTVVKTLASKCIPLQITTSESLPVNITLYRDMRAVGYTTETAWGSL